MRMAEHKLAQIWEQLNPAQKMDLCEKSRVSYDHMRNIVSNARHGKGGYGLRLAEDIAESAYDLGYIGGSRNTVFVRVFPEFDKEAA